MATAFEDPTTLEQGEHFTYHEEEPARVEDELEPEVLGGSDREKSRTSLLSLQNILLAVCGLGIVGWFAFPYAFPKKEAHELTKPIPITKALDAPLPITPPALQAAPATPVVSADPKAPVASDTPVIAKNVAISPETKPVSAKVIDPKPEQPVAAAETRVSVVTEQKPTVKPARVSKPAQNSQAWFTVEP